MSGAAARAVAGTVLRAHFRMARTGREQSVVISSRLVCTKFIRVRLSKVMIRHSIRGGFAGSGRTIRGAAAVPRPDAEPRRCIAELGPGLDPPASPARADDPA